MAGAEIDVVLLTLILCALLGYVVLVLPVAVVVGRALRQPLDPYAAEPAGSRAVKIGASAAL